MEKETLEEAAFNFTAGKSVKEVWSRMDFIRGAIFGAKWQAERMYTEEDLREAFLVARHVGRENIAYEFENWIEKHKKK